MDVCVSKKEKEKMEILSIEWGEDKNGTEGEHIFPQGKEAHISYTLMHLYH
jgi:hypothetical protein